MSAPTGDVDGTTEHVLYAERPEWADVVPVAQYENMQPLAPIFYSPECTQPSVVLRTCTDRSAIYSVRPRCSAG
jgi:hypothetical protein